MKKRNGFVSNSSSSSFVIKLKDITEEQKDKILRHSEVGEELGIPYAAEWEWHISITDEEIGGSTIMDNFEMSEFLEKIGVPDNVIIWEEE